MDRAGRMRLPCGCSCQEVEVRVAVLVEVWRGREGVPEGPARPFANGPRRPRMARGSGGGKVVFQLVVEVIAKQ